MLRPLRPLVKDATLFALGGLPYGSSGAVRVNRTRKGGRRISRRGRGFPDGRLHDVSSRDPLHGARARPEVREITRRGKEATFHDLRISITDRSMTSGQPGRSHDDAEEGDG